MAVKKQKMVDKPEKIVIDSSYESADQLKEKAAKMMEDAALGEMIRDMLKKQEAEKEGPKSLDDLRKIRQQKNEEMELGEEE